MQISELEIFFEGNSFLNSFFAMQFLRNTCFTHPFLLALSLLNLYVTFFLGPIDAVRKGSIVSEVC